MSEIIEETPRTEAIEQSSEEHLESKKRMLGLLEGMESINDVSYNFEATAKSASEMIDAMGIEEDFFDDRTRATLFILAANKAARSDSYHDKERAADIALILSRFHSSETNSLDGILTPKVEEAITDSERMAIYKDYTNKELSQRLEAAIRGDLIQDTRERLGITKPEEDEPFTVRVLAIADDYNMHGITPGPHKELVDELGAQGANDFSSNVSNLEKEFKQRYERFFKEQGMEPLRGAAAWVTTIEGETQLCVMQPTAEKVLDRESVTGKTDYYTDEDWDRERHLIAHEFVHTQGMLSKNGLGLSLEELRAEELANSAAGYNEIKSFITDIKLVTGVDIREIIQETFSSGGKGAEVYTRLAAELGVDATLDIVSALPDVYLSDKEGISKLRRDVSLSTGGFNEIIERLYVKAVEDGKREAVEERFRKAAKFYTNFDDADADMLLRMRSSYGLKFSSEKIRKIIGSKKAA